MKTNRIYWIDLLRGLAIFLVVYGHILMFYQYQGIQLPTIRFIYSFHMPLFFFISGFVSFKEKRQWNLFSFFQFIKNKTIYLLIPSTLFFLIYILVNRLNFTDSIYDKFKAGYWFTFVLFLFYIIYSTCCFLGQKITLKVKNIPIGSFLLLSIAAITTYLLSISYPTEGNAAHKPYLLFSVEYWSNFTFFAVGILARKYDNYFFHFISNRFFLAIALYISFSTAVFWGFIPNNLQIPLKGTLSYLLTPLSSVFILVVLFITKEKLVVKTKIGKSLLFTGQRTMDIFFHYCPRKSVNNLERDIL